MKIFKKICKKVLFFLLLTIGMSVPLCSWAGMIPSKNTNAEVLIAARAFNDYDCKRYLDRNLLAKGYQPIQIIIKNNSNKQLLFNPEQVSLPLVTLENVLSSAHTSTVGRVTGYTAAAVLTSGLFLIPAAVDGYKSSNANRSLDADYSTKCARRMVLQPHTKLNKLLFVPVGRAQGSFTVTLTDVNTNKSFIQEVSLN